MLLALPLPLDAVVLDSRRPHPRPQERLLPLLPLLLAAATTLGPARAGLLVRPRACFAGTAAGRTAGTATPGDLVTSLALPRPRNLLCLCVQNVAILLVPSNKYQRPPSSAGVALGGPPAPGGTRGCAAGILRFPVPIEAQRGAEKKGSRA